MGSKRYTPERIISNLREAEELLVCSRRLKHAAHRGGQRSDWQRAAGGIVEAERGW